MSETAKISSKDQIISWIGSTSGYEWVKFRGYTLRTFFCVLVLNGLTKSMVFFLAFSNTTFFHLANIYLKLFFPYTSCHIHPHFSTVSFSVSSNVLSANKPATKDCSVPLLFRRVPVSHSYQCQKYHSVPRSLTVTILRRGSNVNVRKVRET